MVDKFDSMYDTTTAFVRHACAGRDPSHGLEHMVRVCHNALKILDEENTMGTGRRPARADVMLVALLHDVADHKYDEDGTLEHHVLAFLKTQRPDEVDNIMNAITAISFSKEKKKGKGWYTATLNEYWCAVRDIVSDADKLEAIGVIGIERCQEYGAALGDASIKHVLHHMLDKLLILKDEYIKTGTGKKMAEPLHNDMVRVAIQLAVKEL